MAGLFTSVWQMLWDVLFFWQMVSRFKLYMSGIDQIIEILQVVNG